MGAVATVRKRREAAPVVAERVHEVEVGSLALTPEELGRLLELSGGINELLDVSETLDRVSSAARSLLGTDMSTVLILDEAREHLDVVAADGLDDAIARGLSTPLGKNLAGIVAETGKPMRCCDVPADSRSRLPAVREAGISSAMLVPLEHHGQVIGVLAVEEVARRRFTHRELRILQLLANHAATAIEKARLYAAEHEHVEELRELVGRVRTQNTLMQRGREAHERLTQIVLEGLGMQSLAETTAELVGVPIAISNQFGRLMHLGSAGRHDEALELWRECSGSPGFRAELEQLRENIGMGEPAPVAAVGFWRTAPAVAAGEILGFIVALEHERLNEGDMTVLEQAANIVSAELLRERSVANAEARLHGDILRALVVSDRNGREAHEQAALLGHDLSAPQCVVAAEPLCETGELDPAMVTSAGGWACAQQGLRGMFANVDGVTVALLSEGDRALSRDSVEAWATGFADRLKTLSAEGDVRFGVGSLSADPPDIRGSYESARQALAVSELYGGDGPTHFEDAELLATLVTAADREPLHRFVRRCIGKLVDYDRDRGTDLAGTLEVYLDHSGVARHAAKALYLHPHSLRYRLRRIAEIQEIDLKDPTERLMAHLALKLRSVV